MYNVAGVQQNTGIQRILCTKYSFSDSFPLQIIIFLKIYLFYLFYFWLRWVFAATHGLSLVAVSGGYSSLRWLLLLRSTGSRCTGFSSCGTQPLEHRLSSCGTRAQLLHGMWDLPGPRLEPMSPALAGGCLTTAPPGKPLHYRLLKNIEYSSLCYTVGPCCLF